jgi:hypothetical protein
MMFVYFLMFSSDITYTAKYPESFIEQAKDKKFFYLLFLPLQFLISLYLTMHEYSKMIATKNYWQFLIVLYNFWQILMPFFDHYEYAAYYIFEIK